MDLPLRSRLLLHNRGKASSTSTIPLTWSYNKTRQDRRGNQRLRVALRRLPPDPGVEKMTARHCPTSRSEATRDAIVDIRFRRHHSGPSFTWKKKKTSKYIPGDYETQSWQDSDYTNLLSLGFTQKIRALPFGIHIDIPGLTQKPARHSLGFTQISTRSHKNKFQLFPTGFTQISLGSHRNTLTTLWDSYSYPWDHRDIKIRALLHRIHTYNLRETRSTLSGIHIDIPKITEKINANSSPRDSHRYYWAHTETRSPLSGIHTKIRAKINETL